MRKQLKRNLSDIILTSLFLLGIAFFAPLFLLAATQFSTNQYKDLSVTNSKIAPGVSAEKIGGDTSVNDTEYKSLDGVTSPIQAQLNDKEPEISTDGDTLTYHSDKTWRLVNLSNEITGNLGMSHLNGGTGADSTTYLRGDGVWSGVVGANGGTVTGSGTIGKMTKFISSSEIGDADITLLETPLYQSALDTDSVLTANSDVKVPSQKAVKAYIDGKTGGGTATDTDLKRIDFPYQLWRNALNVTFTGYVDIQVQISDDKAFGDTDFQYDSGTSQTGWVGFSSAGSNYVAWSASGMYATDLMSASYTGTVNLVTGTVYYMRWRVYEHLTTTYGYWVPGGIL